MLYYLHESYYLSIVHICFVVVVVVLSHQQPTNQPTIPPIPSIQPSCDQVKQQAIFNPKKYQQQENKNKNK